MALPLRSIRIDLLTFHNTNNYQSQINKDISNNRNELENKWHPICKGDSGKNVKTKTKIKIQPKKKNVLIQMCKTIMEIWTFDQ